MTTPSCPPPLIQRANDTDLELLAELGYMFLAELGFDKTWHRDAARRAAHHTLTKGFVLMLVQPGHLATRRHRDWGKRVVQGYIGVIVEHHHLTCVRTATEVAWYMQPQFRKGRGAFRLLDAAETRARDVHGAEVIQMSALTERVGLFLSRRGYTAKQVTLTKPLT